MNDGLATPAELRDRYLGCLLGGAVGDALGAPVEFMRLEPICEAFGAGGIRDFAPAYGRLGSVTDDTQMTLFTAEGLLRAWVQKAVKKHHDPRSVVQRACLRWLATPGQAETDAARRVPLDGWLIEQRALWSSRAPGLTCLSALQTAGPDYARADNDSKGCGGVMRAAPVGLMAPLLGDNVAVFSLACDLAASTHGHPSGSLSAGALAVVIAELLRGQDLTTAIDVAAQCLWDNSKDGEVYPAMRRAQRLAREAGPSITALESLGEGWVAEEALSMSLYCGLAAPDFECALVLAVNHGGDSDSTGAITGNILGALQGRAALPSRWLRNLELHEVIAQIAEDLYEARPGGALDPQAAETQARYPPW